MKALKTTTLALAVAASLACAPALAEEVTPQDNTEFTYDAGSGFSNDATFEQQWDGVWHAHNGFYDSSATTGESHTTSQYTGATMEAQTAYQNGITWAYNSDGTTTTSYVAPDSKCDTGEWVCSATGNSNAYWNEDGTAAGTSVEYADWYAYPNPDWQPATENPDPTPVVDPISTDPASETSPVDDPDPEDGIPDGEYGYQEERLYDPAEEPQSEEQAVEEQVQTFEEDPAYTGTGIDGYGNCDDYGIAIEGGCREPQPGEPGYDERQQMLRDQEGATNDQYTGPSDSADGAGEPVPTETPEPGADATAPVATDAATDGDSGTPSPSPSEAERDEDAGSSLAHTGANALRLLGLLALGGVTGGALTLAARKDK